MTQAGAKNAGWRKLRAALLLAGAAATLPACSAIRESRGYIIDPTLTGLIQPKIDNQQSVEGTLGRPTFTSQFGTPTWYYVSSITGQWSGRPGMVSTGPIGPALAFGTFGQSGLKRNLRSP